MEMGPFVGLSKIGQINIPVHNLDVAVSFYRDILKMQYLFQVPNMAFFDCGGIRLMLGVPEDPAFDHPASIIYFSVDDIHSTTETLRSEGVIITGEPELIAEMPDHDLWMSFFHDPDRNTHALMSEIPRLDRNLGS